LKKCASLFAFTAPALLGACQYSEDRHIVRAVDSSEIVGRWEATRFAMESLQSIGFNSHLNPSEHFIVVSENGSCQLETFANLSDFPSIDYTWVSAEYSCSWSLGGDGKHQSIKFEVGLPDGGRVDQYYYFDEESEGLVLWQYVTDPDSWKYMEFSKHASGT